MRKTKFYFLACSLSMGTLVGAQAQNLTEIYTGNSLPTGSWTELKLSAGESDAAGTVSASIVDEALQLIANNGGDTDKLSQLGWYRTDLGLNPASGYTIEIKAKINNAEKNGAFNIQGYDPMGYGFRVGLYNGKIAESTNPFAATNTVASVTNDDGQFHIYRIAVEPNGVATVYFDNNIVPIGTFNVAPFKFDNIIENGGFEDGEEAEGALAEAGEASYNKEPGDNAIGVSNPDMPDFKSSGFLYRIDNRIEGNEGYVHSGNWAMMMDNNGMAQAVGTTSGTEQAKTRELAVKKGTRYNISITRKRAPRYTTGLTPLNPTGQANRWGWRDLFAFWDNAGGTLEGLSYPKGDGGTHDGRDNSFTDGGMNDDWWQTHPHSRVAPDDVESMRFEFPSWHRGDDGGSYCSENVVDDFYVWEDLGLVKGQDITTASLDVNSSLLPVNYVNLIQNGGFEDFNMNNDGTPYEWALSEGNASNDPTKNDNPVWEGNVRLQVNFKDDEDMGWAENKPWAHSGTASIRATTHGQGTNFKFTKELDANKTYCFNFWIRLPKWPDGFKLNVNVGSNNVWNEGYFGDWDHFNHWKNVNITFTTTETDKTLTLFSSEGGDWFNAYFDDMVLYEVTPDPVMETDPDAGKTNLFANGDFEDETIDNNGDLYTWALASTGFTRPDGEGTGANNYPVAYSDFWGASVRLQDEAKPEDIESDWAHSGNNSLRISYLDHRDVAQMFDEITDGSDPVSWRQNIHMNYELEPNTTYTFVFWIKAAAYEDWGDVFVDNGTINLWREAMSRRYSHGWFKQRITFTTTAIDHTLKMYTKFGGWFNFYLDDIALYKEETYEPITGTDYLFFGKSTGTQNADVEIEYISVDNTGAYAPRENPGNSINATPAIKNLKISRAGDALLFNSVNPTSVIVYNASGMIVSQFDMQKSNTISLPKGVYIVKATSNGVTETIKAVN